MNKSETQVTENKEKTPTLWCKCTSCDHIVYKKDLAGNFKICPKCGYGMRMSSGERIEMLVDKNPEGHLLFTEIDSNLASQDPLKFGQHDASEKHRSPYLSKLQHEQRKTSLTDAVICGEGILGGHQAVMAVMDFEFMGGSMGSVVGEKVTRAIERALELRVPFMIISSSGGARMQEGALSLMQMAKTSAALSRLHEAGILAISILCDPTTGGVTASFSMLGDIMIAEPKALIAFAGPRVIEQTIREQLPPGFQQSEFLLKHGMIDCIVERKDLKSTLVKFLEFFSSSK